MKLNPIRQKVYKVLKRDDYDRLISCTAPVNWRITYKPQDVVRPLFGKIFAFSTLRGAQKFALEESTLFEIWEAEGFGVKAAKKRAPVIGYLKLHEVWSQLDGYPDSLVIKINGYEHEVRNVPEDTVFCKSLKLLKKVI